MVTNTRSSSLCQTAGPRWPVIPCTSVCKCHPQSIPRPPPLVRFENCPCREGLLPKPQRQCHLRFLHLGERESGPRNYAFRGARGKRHSFEDFVFSFILNGLFVFCFFGRTWGHVEVPGPGIEPEPQQQPEPQQWQCWILNLLGHQGTPHKCFFKLGFREFPGGLVG